MKSNFTPSRVGSWFERLLGLVPIGRQKRAPCTSGGTINCSTPAPPPVLTKRTGVGDDSGDVHLVRLYPSRVRCRFQNRSGYVVLDQLRAVDRDRLVKRLGALSTETVTGVLDGLQEMFAE
jgi:hypothetical protein